MKRLIAVLLCAVLLACLFAGCSAKIGGKYVLVKITAEGKELPPASMSISVHFTLEEDGTGSASYNGKPMQIAWNQEGKSLYLTAETGVLELRQSGKDLIFEKEGTRFVFEPEETEDN